MSKEKRHLSLKVISKPNALEVSSVVDINGNINVYFSTKDEELAKKDLQVFLVALSGNISFTPVEGEIVAKIIFPNYEVDDIRLSEMGLIIL